MDLDKLLCPLNRAPLSLAEGDEKVGVLAAGETPDDVLSPGGGSYPILGGLPIVVPDAAGYLAAHREAVLASLAEEGLADLKAVTLLRRFADGVRGGAPVGFEDDWTAGEAAGEPAPFAAPDTDAGRALDAFLEALPDPWERVAGSLTHRHREVLEVGPGAGALTKRLDDHGRRLWLTDLNPRALFAARRRAPQASLAVMDAEALAFADASFDGIVAANVIDLLAHPIELIAAAGPMLRPGGRLVLTTPDPWPWAGEEQHARELVGDHGMKLITFADDLLWPRFHGDREMQLFRLQPIVAEKV